jgi:hypothetical protein
MTNVSIHQFRNAAIDGGEVTLWVMNRRDRQVLS